MVAAAFIPARMASSRFPGKPLALLDGRPLIQHVCAGASKVSVFSHVYVATDDQRIFDAVAGFGGTPVMTGTHHQSGSDRIIEALGLVDPSGRFDIVVNIQGDEPLIRPAHVQKCVEALAATKDADWATLVHPLGSDAEFSNPNMVKVVRDSRGFALYFSRAPIPFDRDGCGGAPRLGHCGLYAYRPAALKRFASLAHGVLESVEKLEQLRALEHGMRILCVEVDSAAQGVDTPADLERVGRMLAAQPELSNIT